MKKLLTIIVYILFIILPIMVEATSGKLRGGSTKTCPNGVLYGAHGSNGTHWHVAVKRGNSYYASGAAIYKDPCPNSTKDKQTIDNDSSSNDNSTSDNNANNYGIIQNNENNNNSELDEVNTDIEEKSNDNSIKRITIDGEQINISDNMTFETIKKHILINIETNDLKSTVDYENKDLVFGENVINIVVTAENGEKKDYNLVINKIKGEATAKIKEFILGAVAVKFENNKAIATKLKSENSLNYSYKLSDKDAKLKMYLNEKEVSKLDSLKENDKIKLIVFDKNDNINEYEITIKDASSTFSVIVYILSALVLSSPLIWIIHRINKK